MASFLADSLQEPLEKERGDFIKIGDDLFKIRGEAIGQLLLLGFVCVDPSENDPRYPFRVIYKLLRFTENEMGAIRRLIRAALEAKA